MSKLPSRTTIFKYATVYAVYLIIVWGFYRFLFRFPDQVEELIIKPIVWLVPLVFLLKKEGIGFSSLGFTLKNLFPAVYFSIGLGAIFVMEGLFVNYAKYGSLNFAANIGALPLMTSLGISFATAFSEETAFRGYIFSRFAFALNNEWTANIVQAVLWTGIHVPIAFFVWNLSLPAALLYLALTGVFGLGSAFIFGRTNNIVGSVLLHVLWEWPIILFR